MNTYSDQDLARWLMAAKAAAKAGSQVLLDYWGRLSQVQEKPRAGLVSEADVQSEAVIKEVLLKSAPEATFLGEESGGENAPWHHSNPCWVVDPLDGTTNYVHGVPSYCVSIGLTFGPEVLIGVVEVPPLSETYYAFKGGGAFKDSKPIKVSERTEISDTLLATGFFRDEPEALREQLRIFNQLIFQARGIRRIGAAAYDLCLVAEGVFDAFWERNLKPWDTCAGTLLVREAGGVVTNYRGEQFSLDHGSILAGNSIVHAQLLEKMKSI